MNQDNPYRSPVDTRRRGMTMIELLIVVSVMVILMAITLPAMKTGIDSRRLSAAAEMVVNQIRFAQSQAAERNIPVSVVLTVDRLSSAVTTIGIASAGQRYAGDVVGSQALVTYAGPTGLRCQLDDANAGTVIHADDTIRFSHLWHSYRVVAIAQSGAAWILDLESIPSQRPPIPDPPNWYLVPPSPSNPAGILGTSGTAKYSFVVAMRPRTMSSQVELPPRSCVDLSASGYGFNDVAFNTGATIAQTVILDFVPDGRLRSIRFAGLTEQIPVDPVYLSIGNVDAIGSQVSGLPENATNPQCRWVRINPTTGRVASLPVSWTPSHATLANSRELED